MAGSKTRLSRRTTMAALAASSFAMPYVWSRPAAAAKQLVVRTPGGVFDDVKRETVYERRRSRIADQFGGIVPAYAVATAGAPVDVAPSERERRRRRVNEPEAPERGVSRQEFDEMVRDLHVDTPPSGTATAERDPTADADPEDLVFKDDKPKREKQKKPRNKRHGRAR